MFGIESTEMIILFVVALLLFGVREPDHPAAGKGRNLGAGAGSRHHCGRKDSALAPFTRICMSLALTESLGSEHDSGIRQSKTTRPENGTPEHVSRPPRRGGFPWMAQARGCDRDRL